LAQDHILAQELFGVWRIRDEGQKGVEKMVKHLDDAGLSDAAGLKVLHSILSGEVDGLHLGHGIAHQVGLLTRLILWALLKDVNLIAYQDFDWDLTGPFALSDPLLDPLEGGPLCDIKQINNGG
jgi:hypothetical protein